MPRVSSSEQAAALALLGALKLKREHGESRQQTAAEIEKLRSRLGNIQTALKAAQASIKPVDERLDRIAAELSREVGNISTGLEILGGSVLDITRKVGGIPEPHDGLGLDPEHTRIDGNGRLILAYTNGRKVDVGPVRGKRAGGVSFIPQREEQFGRVVQADLDYQVLGDDSVVVMNAQAGLRNVMMPPTASALNRIVTVKKRNTTGGDVRVIPHDGSADTVEFDTDLLLTGECRPAVRLLGIPGNWIILGTGLP